MGPLSLVTSATSTVASAAWPYVVPLARQAVCALLSRVNTGSLTIEDVDGKVWYFGDHSKAQGAEKLAAKITVRKEAFWLRLAIFTDMVCPESSPRKEFCD